MIIKNVDGFYFVHFIEALLFAMSVLPEFIIPLKRKIVMKIQMHKFNLASAALNGIKVLSAKARSHPEQYPGSNVVTGPVHNVSQLPTRADTSQT